MTSVYLEYNYDIVTLWVTPSTRCKPYKSVLLGFSAAQIKEHIKIIKSYHKSENTGYYMQFCAHSSRYKFGADDGNRTRTVSLGS